MISTKKSELEKVAWSDIFLYLFKNVIRAVSETKIASELWAKFQSKYMTKSLKPHQTVFYQKLLLFYNGFLS